MVRRYEEPIEVRATADAQTGPGAPDAFVWRGRLYVVRAVLDHWQERRPWWRGALDGDGSPGRPGLPDEARERRVWRVEASAGRLAGAGVYDLGADPSRGQWQLLQVAD